MEGFYVGQRVKIKSGPESDVGQYDGVVGTISQIEQPENDAPVFAIRTEAGVLPAWFFYEELEDEAANAK